VLITHAPPHGICDRTVGNMNVGCAKLGRVVEIKQPRLHVFGHIHEGKRIKLKIKVVILL